MRNHGAKGRRTFQTDVPTDEQMALSNRHVKSHSDVNEVNGVVHGERNQFALSAYEKLSILERRVRQLESELESMKPVRKASAALDGGV